MNPLGAIAETLGLHQPWRQIGHAFRLDCEGLDSRAVAQAMLASHARFITITAMQLPEDEGISLDYYWDLEGQLLCFHFLTEDKTISSIYDLCEAANWIEREIHEYYAVDFYGRGLEPLFLRSGQELGVNLREEDE